MLPAQEWVLVRTGSGAVTATLRDHRTGAVQTTFASEPARGDAVRFELGPAASQETIEAGEAVGIVSSGESALRLSAVRGQIEQAQAQLRLSGVGAKTEVVDAARQDVRRAEAQAAQAEAEASRQRELFEGGLTSEYALQEAESAVRLAEAGVASAEARVRVASAGQRSEEADVVRARIRALNREASSLSRREAMGTLVSPISGRVHRVFSPDTLLLVADVSSYHVLLPVRWTDRDRVRVGAHVTLKAGTDRAPVAKIVDIREAAVPRAGQAYLVAMAEVVQGAEHLVPGLLVPADVESESKTPLEYTRAALRDLFRW